MKEIIRKQDPRARIPAVNKLAAQLQTTHSDLSHKPAVRMAQVIAAELRANPNSSPETLQERYLEILKHPGPKPVINATGILLHTNLGRSPIDPKVLEAAAKQVSGYTDLEYNLDSGKRGHRDRHFRTLAQLVWGVEDATLVNNAAAAVTLSLAATAGGQETIVSRGELIEIGGSFRLPDIMEVSGTRLVEVGATNKTKPDDYRRAIGQHTGCLLKTHTSNYRIEGFTSETSLQEITQIGKENDIPVIMDLGSGLSRSLPFPPTSEPFIEDYLEAAPDLLIFSGDKLFGGVQAGVVLGTAKAVEKLRKHPMMRMLRQDKLSISIICHQLRDTYLQGHNTFSHLASHDQESLRSRAKIILDQCPNVNMKIIEDVGYIGGGSLPQEQRPSICLQIEAAQVQKMARSLRLAKTPLIGYVRNDKLHINLASVFPFQDPSVIDLLNQCQ